MCISEMHAHVHRKTHARMCRLCCNNPELAVPLVVKVTTKLWCSHIAKCYTAMRMSKLQLDATVSVSSIIIMLSKRSHTLKNSYDMIIYMYVYTIQKEAILEESNDGMREYWRFLGAYNDLFLHLDAGYMDGFTLILHYTRTCDLSLSYKNLLKNKH